MKIKMLPRKWRRFTLQIVFPVVLVGVLFVLAIFQVLIPTMGRQLMERKKETIRELTLAAWSILESYHQEEINARMTQQDAQQQAAERIGALRYGEDGKDYFWITDLHPNMIVHPYRADLNGQDLSQFEDSSGKKLFVEFVQAVQPGGAGYVDYYWQWKDDPAQVVPKLSYVKLFEPWGWVIGTGIYVEDVREDIRRIERNLVYISLGITALMVLILFYITRQSLAIEQQRTKAEENLRESHEKYRTLVESSAEGTLMVLDGKCAFSNRALLDRLGYTAQELDGQPIENLLPGGTKAEKSTKEFIASLLQGETVPAQIEAHIKHKDGSLIEVLLTATQVNFAGQQGFILVARDMAYYRELEATLGETRRQAKTLTRTIPLGVFRSTWGKRTRLLEANPAMRRLFALDGESSLDGFDWLEQIIEPQERSALVSCLNAEETVQDFRLTMRAAAGQRIEVSCFAILVRDGNEPAYCDAILEDISARTKAEQERDALIAQLQASQFYLEEPLHNVLNKAVTCEMNLPIVQAAARMTKAGSSALVVCGQGGEALGIITDHDLRERVLAAALPPESPVYQIISAPLRFISEHALVYEAILMMQESDVSCLAVKDDAGNLKGTVRHIDLVQYRQHSAMILTHTVRRARSVDELRSAYERLPQLIETLIDAGTRVRHINRIVSSISDGIASRLLEMDIETLGPPPVRYAFLSLGSEGREEQTLVTDQDNALIYEDPPPGDEETVRDYFLALGTRVCDHLDQVGYAYCHGGVMAKNPSWNQPVSAWKRNFHHWIHNANPQELLELNMAFDFRCVSGETSLAQQLRAWVFAEMDAYQPFFLHFAQNVLLYKPPLGIFGNIQVESSAEGVKSLNLKEAMLPVVNYARLYALKHQIEETHTIDRLARLYDKGLLSRELFEELIPAYETLMRMRLHRQAEALRTGRKPGNLITRHEWTPLEETTLKRTFSILGSLRKKISYDFLGTA